MFPVAIRQSHRIAFAVFCLALIGTLSPIHAQDAPPDEAEAMVRINRLENMMRQMQGQIEELQFANQKLQEQLRFLSPNGDQGPSGQSQNVLPNSPSPVVLPPTAPGPKPVEIPPSPTPQNSAQQNLPPKSASGPINLLAAGKAPQFPAGQAGPGTPPMTLEQAAAAAVAGQTPQTSPVATAPVQPPVEQRSNFEIAKDAIAAKDFDKAVNVLTGIVEGNPKEPKIPDALMMLGDAQYRLKRYAEAAQRYLKLAQTYPKHPDAGLAFVRLGLSLNELGQKPQACATFAEFAKRYPSAKASVKAEADRGRKAASCG